MKPLFLSTIILLFSLNSFSQINTTLFCKSWVLLDATDVTAGELYNYIPADAFYYDSTTVQYRTITFDENGSFSTAKQFTPYADEQMIAYLAGECGGSSYIKSSTWEIEGNTLKVIDTVVNDYDEDEQPVEYHYLYEIISIEKDKMTLKYIR